MIIKFYIFPNSIKFLLIVLKDIYEDEEVHENDIEDMDSCPPEARELAPWRTRDILAPKSLVLRGRDATACGLPITTDYARAPCKVPQWES